MKNGAPKTIVETTSVGSRSAVASIQGGIQLRFRVDADRRVHFDCAVYTRDNVRVAVTQEAIRVAARSVRASMRFS